MLYIVGRITYVYVRDACSISRVHMIVPFEIRSIPWGDMGASEKLGRTSIAGRLVDIKK